MPDEIPSKLSKAKLSEKDAWQRYAAAKGDNWREAFAKWVEARDALIGGMGRRSCQSTQVRLLTNWQGDLSVILARFEKSPPKSAVP